MRGSHSLLRGEALICALLALLAAPLFLYSVAEATVYDDFNGSAIDTMKWQVLDSPPGTTGLFSESGGTLNYSTQANNEWERLTSYPHTFPGLFQASLEFSNFSSTNVSKSGMNLSSGVEFILFESQWNYVEVIRGHNGGLLGGGSYDFIQVDYVFAQGTTLDKFYVTTNSTAGVLGFNLVMGPALTMVQPYYTVGGQTYLLGPSIFPAGWTLPPGLTIYGFDGPTGSTSFSVNNVTYSSVPIPPAFVLFGPGLVGLAAIRRRFKR